MVCTPLMIVKAMSHVLSLLDDRSADEFHLLFVMSQLFMRSDRMCVTNNIPSR